MLSLVERVANTSGKVNIREERVVSLKGDPHGHMQDVTGNSCARALRKPLRHQVTTATLLL